VRGLMRRMHTVPVVCMSSHLCHCVHFALISSGVVNASVVNVYYISCSGGSRNCEKCRHFGELEL